MTKKQGDLRSPLNSAFPHANSDGDKRDFHDQNPHRPFNEAVHTRGKDTPKNLFFEGEDLGDVMGVVAHKTKDILSSPMGGQRRSATTERESPNSTLGIEKK